MRRIALVAPQAVPAVIGGAENLWAGLLKSLNDLADVSAEFITLPTPEKTLKEVLAGYAQFSRLDLSRFDQVITTKYPAWAVTHPHHTVYLQHTLRGLYDTYPIHLGYSLNPDQILALKKVLPEDVFDALALAATQSWAEGDRQRAAMLATNSGERSLADVAESLALVLDSALNQGLNLTQYPGPYARACVRLLDAIAFEANRIHRFFAISQTVEARTDYFPEDALVTICHHPTNTAVKVKAEDKDNNKDPSRDLIVTASRLENPKRVDLLIDAYIESGVSLPFWIIGDGPSAEQLRAKAKDHPGIIFKGKLSEAELVTAYQRALFVPFVPKQEDYGLITVEAFLAGSAVLTTTDAGGPTELVRHQENGWIASPTLSSLAQGFRELVSDPGTTMSYGQSGIALAQKLQWPALVDTLVNAPARLRKRVLVVNTFPTEPTNSGGRLRMKGLYQALSRFHDVHMLSLGDRHQQHILKEHVPTHSGRFVEEIIPVSDEFVTRAKSLSKQTGASCGDIAVSLYPETLAEYQFVLRRGLSNADCVVFSHPYIFPVYERLIRQSPSLKRPVVYEAHNVESFLKESIYPTKHRVLHAVQSLEIRLLSVARFLVTCSEQDQEGFQGLMQSQAIGVRKTVLCPNAVDSCKTSLVSVKERIAVSEGLGYRTALFAASDHGPNHEALLEILQACQTPEVQSRWKVVVLGSVVNPWHSDPRFHELRDTLILRGLVSETEKNLWLQRATIGLNPMRSGSGTNLKLAEYAAWSLPILSTHFGARGGLWRAWEHYMPQDLELFQEMVAVDHRLTADGADWLQTVVSQAKALADEDLTWARSAGNFARALDQVLLRDN